MTPRRVVITIDEIVLHGVDNPGRAATAAALERELVRIFRERPVAPRQGSETARVTAPTMVLGPHATLASGLAERVHGGVTDAARPRGVGAGQRPRAADGGG